MKALPILAIVCLSSNVSAQKIKEADVPAYVKSALSKQYPNAKIEKWEKEGNNFEAEVMMDKKEFSLVFDGDGTLLETEMEIEISSLPGAISDYVKKNLAGKKISEASKITSADGKVKFEAEVGNDDYIFDDTGKLISKETDTDKDDDKKH